MITGIFNLCNSARLYSLKNYVQLCLIAKADYHPDPQAALAAAKTAKLHAAAEAAQARRSQVRTVDRSERIRTYNFPENRIADHRTGFKAYNLDAVLDGDLGPVIASAIAMDEAERLSQVGEGSGS